MILIRTALEADLPRLLEIYNDIIVNTTAVYDYAPHTLAMRRQWFQTKQEQGFPVLVAELDGQIAGFASFGPFRAWEGFKHTVENSVYVAPEYRGKGVAKQLMPALIEAARKLNLHAMVAGIDADNEASIQLHQYFGFEEVAHFKQVGKKFDRWLDLKFLELILA